MAEPVKATSNGLSSRSLLPIWRVDVLEPAVVGVRVTVEVVLVAGVVVSHHLAKPFHGDLGPQQPPILQRLHEKPGDSASHSGIRSLPGVYVNSPYHECRSCRTH